MQIGKSWFLFSSFDSLDQWINGFFHLFYFILYFFLLSPFFYYFLTEKYFSLNWFKWDGFEFGVVSFSTLAKEFSCNDFRESTLVVVDFFFSIVTRILDVDRWRRCSLKTISSRPECFGMNASKQRNNSFWLKE